MKNLTCNTGNKENEVKKVCNSLLSEMKIFLDRIEYELLIEELKYYQLDKVNKEVIRVILYSVLGLRYEETRVKRVYLSDDLVNNLELAKSEDLERKANLPNLANFILDVCKLSFKAIEKSYKVKLSEEAKIQMKYIKKKYQYCKNVNEVIAVMSNTIRNKKTAKVQPLKLTDYQIQFTENRQAENVLHWE